MLFYAYRNLFEQSGKYGNPDHQCRRKAGYGYCDRDYSAGEGRRAWKAENCKASGAFKWYHASVDEKSKRVYERRLSGVLP